MKKLLSATAMMAAALTAMQSMSRFGSGVKASETMGDRQEQTASGRRRSVTRVSEEKRSRYSGRDLRALRAERGVGPVRKIARSA